MYGRRIKTTDTKRASINGGSFVSNYSERSIIEYYQKSVAQHRFSGVNFSDICFSDSANMDFNSSFVIFLPPFYGNAHFSYTSFKESQTLKNGSFLLDKTGRHCFIDWRKIRRKGHSTMELAQIYKMLNGGRWSGCRNFPEKEFAVLCNKAKNF